MLQSDSNIMFYIVITCRSMPLSLHWYNIYNSVSECIIIITIITIIIVIIRTKGEDTRDACCQAEIMQPTSETSSLNHFQFQPAVHFMKKSRSEHPNTYRTSGEEWCRYKWRITATG